MVEWNSYLVITRWSKSCNTFNKVKPQTNDNHRNDLFFESVIVTLDDSNENKNSGNDNEKGGEV